MAISNKSCNSNLLHILVNMIQHSRFGMKKCLVCGIDLKEPHLFNGKEYCLVHAIQKKENHEWVITYLELKDILKSFADIKLPDKEFMEWLRKI